MPLLFKLLHVLIAIWFISGLVGRTFASREAARSSDIGRVRALVDVAGRFDRLAKPF